MKRIAITILLALSITALGFAADEKKKDELPPLPSEIKLTNGVTLHNASVEKWQTDRVTIRHQGGIAPIFYIHIVPEQRKLFEARKVEGIAATKTLQQLKDNQAGQATATEQRAADLRTRVAEAIRKKSLIVGMTKDEAIQSWGRPIKTNDSGGSYGSHDQWIYESHYIYFQDGVLTSWQTR